MKKFIVDIKKYYKYCVYSGKAELKSEIANSHLSWLWWFLDPLLFMLVYTFVALVVFGKGEQYFPVYVFIGQTSWKFFERTVKQSVKLVASNSSIVTKVYIPKFILIFIKMYANGFKMMVSYILVLLMMVFFRVPVSFKIFYFVPIMLTLMIFTFGASCILLHFGVFMEDLANIMTVFLRLVFYFTGIFYSIDKRVPAPYNHILLKCNPMALLIHDLRQCMLYCAAPHLGLMFLWLVIGCILSFIGVKTIYKYENSYVKVI